MTTRPSWFRRFAAAIARLIADDPARYQRREAYRRRYRNSLKRLTDNDTCRACGRGCSDGSAATCALLHLVRSSATATATTSPEDLIHDPERWDGLS